ncbi:MAG: transcription termination/antitermination protein NusA [Deltaproteobacteria bacterium GWA2_55_10]|nr:MAG: transcription termination/antitermination protein NusA [Deltaproteobacteria bacterium GWA2_55_10]
MLNLANIIDQVGKDKGIDKHILIEALETAVLKAAEKRFGPNKVIEAHYQEEMGEIELFLFKEVVEHAEDPDTQIELEPAKELDPEVAIGDSLGVKLDSKEFGRIDAQTAKQIIIQKVREAERNIVYNEYSSKRGEIVTGIVQRFEKGDIIVDLGRAEALLTKKEQVRREGYRQGERIRGIILEVKVEARGPQIILSRTHPAFLMKLFQMEVPEVYEGIVEIKGAAREPGDRAKIAVLSHNSDVDPVGACVGVKGSRVQAVVQELKGEKIDIVHWSDEPAIFVKNTLSPAQIARVITDEAEHAMEVIVPDDQLSLAIGKKGQNVRLAAKLTGWKIDIRTESDSKGGKEKLSPDEALRKEMQAAGEREERERAAAAKDMEENLGISHEAAVTLAAAGYTGSDSLTGATAEELAKIEGLGQDAIDIILDVIAREKGNA